MQNPSDWQLLDDGSYNGTKKYIRAFDEDEGTVQVKYETVSDAIGAMLDRNKALQNEDWDRKSELVHVASIPNYIFFEWLTKHGIWYLNPNHQDGVRRLLNDSEYRYLKTKDIIL